MPVVIKVVGTGIEMWPESRWRYLKSWDLEAFQGRGSVELTMDKSKAHVFENAGAAMATWNSQSKSVPYRPDGGRNKPLTAYTVEIENADV